MREKFAARLLSGIRIALGHGQPYIALGGLALVQLVQLVHGHPFFTVNFPQGRPRLIHAFHARHAEVMPKGHLHVAGVDGPMPLELFAGFLVTAQQCIRHADLPVFRFLFGLHAQEGRPVTHRRPKVAQLEKGAAAHLINIGKLRIRAHVGERRGVIGRRALVVAHEIHELRALDVGVAVDRVNGHGLIDQLHHAIGLARIKCLDGLQEQLLLFHAREKNGDLLIGAGAARTRHLRLRDTRQHATSHQTNLEKTSSHQHHRTNLARRLNAKLFTRLLLLGLFGLRNFHFVQHRMHPRHVAHVAMIIRHRRRESDVFVAQLQIARGLVPNAKIQMPIK